LTYELLLCVLHLFVISKPTPEMPPLEQAHRPGNTNFRSQLAVKLAVPLAKRSQLPFFNSKLEIIS